ncbi:MAG: YfbK domain-containing protein, partial [Parvularcula sp.]|nr:YfbK domain-containing protein [Parvularcula sp.]
DTAARRSAEAAFVKLRYKLPGGDTSKLIQKIVTADELRSSTQVPQGDFAFAAAVAAFGQILRGDELMMGFDHDDVTALAGRQSNFWRQEFLELNALAGAARGGG